MMVIPSGYYFYTDKSTGRITYCGHLRPPESLFRDYSYAVAMFERVPFELPQSQRSQTLTRSRETLSLSRSRNNWQPLSRWCVWVGGWVGGWVCGCVCVVP
jgi:hypothetical protein